MYICAYKMGCGGLHMYVFASNFLGYVSIKKWQNWTTSD